MQVLFLEGFGMETQVNNSKAIYQDSNKVFFCKNIALLILVAWCLLPIFMCIYDLTMGIIGAFPKIPAEMYGNINYTVAINTYYYAIAILGIVSLSFSLITIIAHRTHTSGISYYRTHHWYLYLSLFLLWAIFSTIFAEDSLFALTGNSSTKTGLITYFFYVGAFLCASMINSDRQIRSILILIMAVICVLSIIMLIQNSGVFFLDYCFPARNAVVFKNSNHFGYILCIGIALTVGLFLFDYNNEATYHVIILILFTLITITLLVNGTLGAYIGAVLSIIAYYTFYIRRHGNISIYIMLPAIIFIAVSAMNALGVFNTGYSLLADFQKTASDIQRITEGVEESDSAGSGRWILWKQTIDRIIDRPVFGFGPDGFYGEYALNRNLNPHNEYLLYAGFHGIPALLFYLAALFSLAAYCWRNLKHISPLQVVLGGTVIAYLASAFFGNPVFNTVPYYWILLGMLSTVDKSSFQSTSDVSLNSHLSFRKKHIVIIIISGLIILSIIITIDAYLNIKTEYQAEMADLQGMKVADYTTRMKFKERLPDTLIAYWFDMSDYSLIPISEPMPEPYGLGSKLNGGALNDFIKEDNNDEYKYDEGLDYHNMIIKVTASRGQSNKLNVRTDWVTYNPSKE